MPDASSAILAIFMMGAIAYGCRISGYLAGTLFRNIERYRSVLEALPGCALMAILGPAAMRGSPIELAALACTVGTMWVTGNVLFSSMVGIAFLLGFGLWLG